MDQTAWEEVDAAVRGQLHQHFRPEFLNRVDDIVVFRPLGVEELAQIVDLQLDRVVELVADLGLVLEVSATAKRYLASEGHDPVFGARPLKRAIQRSIQDPLALFLLDEDVAEGTRIVVDTSETGDGLGFEAVPLDATLRGPSPTAF
jgi:ATP-dependent Clp protease ATP-binding subunit ClpB